MTPTRCGPVLAAVSALLLFAACEAIEDLVDEESPDRDSGLVTAMPSIADAQTAVPDKQMEVAAAAANTLPSFGSVTQSSNRSPTGATTDAASTSFDGRDISLNIRRGTGSSLTLDSAAGASESHDIEFPLEGRSGRAHVLLDFGEALTPFSVAVVHTSWDDNDPMNYLAGGYWVHIDGDLFQPDDIAVEIGAFMDGPELSGTPVLPNQGTASYRGVASGIYAYKYGSGHAGLPRGSAAVGLYLGSVALDADFGANRISGYIDDMTVSAIGTEPDGTEFPIEGETSGMRIDLGRAEIRSDARFASREVSVRIPSRTVVASQGSWGGRFSTIADAAGEPRLAGGTAGAEWSEADGSEGVVLGAYFGRKHQ